MNMEQSSAHSGRKHFGRGNESWELVSNSFSEWLVHRPPLVPTNGGSWDFPLSHVERRQLVVLSLTAEVDQRQAQPPLSQRGTPPQLLLRAARFPVRVRVLMCGLMSREAWSSVGRNNRGRHDPPGLAWEMPMSVQERQDFSISSLILESDERWAETEALVQELTGALTTQSAASNSPKLDSEAVIHRHTPCGDGRTCVVNALSHWSVFVCRMAGKTQPAVPGNVLGNFLSRRLTHVSSWSCRWWQKMTSVCHRSSC